MTCRVCYAKSLTPDECDRFYAEPVTSTIYLCPEHQAQYDDVIKEAGLVWERDVVKRYDHGDYRPITLAAEQERRASVTCAACEKNPPSEGGILCTRCRYSL